MEKGTTYILELSDDVGKAVYDFTILEPSGDNETMKGAKILRDDIEDYVYVNGTQQEKFFVFRAKETGTYKIVEKMYGGLPRFGLYNEKGEEIIKHKTALKFECNVEKDKIYYVGVKGDFGPQYASIGIWLEPPYYDERNITEYQYDGNYNRTKQIEIEDGSLKETLYEYDKNYRLTKMTKDSTETTYEYDNNGNLKEKSDGTKQSYDALNRMISYTSPKNETTIYTYYADDMRKSKKVHNKAEIKQVWMGDDIAMELENGNVKSSYVHGEKLICSDYGFYLYNGHGDVTMLTDSSGNVTKDYEYSSFGKQKSSTTDGDENPYRYSGEYYDMESGYTYLQARYYDPDLGRFVSEDPAMDGDNWYVYCGNDPINMVDPSGRWMGYDHKKITKKAFNEVTSLQKLISSESNELLKKLKEGCVFPDDDSSCLRDIRAWHGHKGYSTIKNKQLNKAVKLWKKDKHAKAFIELGKGLHAIQDHYSHTFRKKGKDVNTWSYVKGKFYKKDKKIIAGKYPEYVNTNTLVKFLVDKRYDGTVKKKQLRKEIRKELIGKNVHKYTADYKYSYFSVKNNKWQWTNAISNRYKKAKTESKKYLNTFAKKIRKK